MFCFVLLCVGWLFGSSECGIGAACAGLCGGICPDVRSISTSARPCRELAWEAWASAARKDVGEDDRRPVWPVSEFASVRRRTPWT